MTNVATHDGARDQTPDEVQGQLIVISGPSGSGKTSLIEALRADPRVRVSVSVTTRPRREHEIDGRDYRFVDRDRFQAMHGENRFIETNDVFGNGHLYGSLWSDLSEGLSGSNTVYIMEVDVTGAENLIEALRDKVEPTYIFIEPPSMEVLEQRLRSRKTDDDPAISRRLGRAAEEIRQARSAGALVIVNDELVRAVAEARGLIGLDDVAPPNP